MADDLPLQSFPSVEAWEAWLDEHHASSRGLWLKIAKRDSGVVTVTHAEALDAAICFGWIDGTRARVDDVYFRQLFTPRRRRSRWSRINRERATDLIAAGRMRPSGMREVKAAQADGRWEAAYEGQRTAPVPEDVRQAFNANKKAAAAFAALDSRNRFAILYRVGAAKRPDTRARRIEQFVEMLKRGEKPYP